MCKSSNFGHNMLKTPVLPDAKLGFPDGLTFPKGEGITQLKHNLTNHRRRRYHNSTLHTPHSTLHSPHSTLHTKKLPPTRVSGSIYYLRYRIPIISAPVLMPMMQPTLYSAMGGWSKSAQAFFRASKAGRLFP